MSLLSSDRYPNADCLPEQWASPFWIPLHTWTTFLGSLHSPASTGCMVYLQQVFLPLVPSPRARWAAAMWVKPGCVSLLTTGQPLLREGSFAWRKKERLFFPVWLLTRAGGESACLYTWKLRGRPPSTTAFRNVFNY